MSETFLILRRTICLCVKYQLFLSDINGIWIFSNRFGQNLKISNFMKIHPVGVDLFPADRRTDRQASRHDGAISRTRLTPGRKKWTFQLHNVHSAGPVAVRYLISGGYCEGAVDNSNTLLKFTVQHMCHLHFLPLLNLEKRFFSSQGGFHVLPAVTTNYAVLRNLALCSLIKIFQCFWSATSTVST